MGSVEFVYEISIFAYQVHILSDQKYSKPESILV